MSPVNFFSQMFEIEYFSSCCTNFYFQTFADWGIDMLKVDGCYSCNSLMPKGYETFGFWLNKTERPILYSCSWPAYIPKDKPYKDIAKLCNIWRNYADIQVRKVFAFYSGKNMY